MDSVLAHGKAILAFISLVVANLLQNYASADVPLPLDNTGTHLDWGKLAINLGTIVIGTMTVHQWDNDKYKRRASRNHKPAKRVAKRTSTPKVSGADDGRHSAP